LANRWWVIGIIGVLIVASVGLYHFARDPYSDQEIRQLIERGYDSQRPGGGRLFGAPYTAAGNATPDTQDLGRAQILLLRLPDSKVHQQLQGLIYLAAADWPKFLELEKDLSIPSSTDAALINNLGASWLALSENDPTLLLKALDAFERAGKLDPKAPEPLFNLVVTYRKLGFSNLADEALHHYSALDSESAWQKEIANPDQKDEATILDQLERAVGSNNLVEAERLFRANPELCRRAAMQYALSEESTKPVSMMRFIANQTDRQYGDKTISAMLAPLLTDQRDVAIAIRRLVRQGAQLYESREYPDSIDTYSEGELLGRKMDSVFDHLWLDLSKVDTLIRLGRVPEARETLSRVVRTSDQERYLWLKARALTVYGATFQLTSSYSEMLDLLSQADREFTHLDAPHDRIRVLYYLSSYRFYRGDQDEALRLALECLRLIDDGNPLRISTLDWLVGSILYRRGMLERALLFEKEAVSQGDEAELNSGVQLQASILLAELYESMSQRDQADKSIALADDAIKRMPKSNDRTKSELLVGIVKAKAKLNRHEYREAEPLLERNLQLYSQLRNPAAQSLSQCLMLLAQVYSETGRVTKAEQKFAEAINVVERYDDYMKSEDYRVKFDVQRRELYDSAIEFEIRNGSFDNAWTYLQKYRAKLFLELLAAFNPNLKATQARLDPAIVQRQIPKDTQILEYALQKDRLLIWLVTDKLFTVRSVSVTRADIEAKVQATLDKLRSPADVDPLLTELGKVLIEPVANLLDPDRTLTIIPDRALHGLPFDALKLPGKNRYLAEDYAIVFSPSLTHFLTTNGAQPSRSSIVGFGSQNGGASEFKELAALADFYPKAATFTGQQVDKPSFLSSLNKAGVFHYAGHSATDAVDPLRSSILLDGNRPGPNSVTAVDISQQRLSNNAVVILSSCDSSVGNSRDGIGVRGLTSAFLIAGAGSVVGSLWPVEASSTADLMIRFHQAYAKSGLPVAKALREAQLSFLKTFPERSNPYYWSGFVVTGNFSTLR
jgi:CHAT domain-containing protein